MNVATVENLNRQNNLLIRKLAQKEARIRELEEIGSFIENARDVLVDASKYFDRYGGVDVDDYGKVRRKIGGMIGVLRDVVITYNAISDKSNQSDKEDSGE